MISKSTRKKILEGILHTNEEDRRSQENVVKNKHTRQIY
jgi:hypothetical protein